MGFPAEVTQGTDETRFPVAYIELIGWGQPALRLQLLTEWSREKAMVHHGVTLTQTLKQAKTPRRSWTTARFLRLSSLSIWGHAQNLTPATDSAALMIISHSVSAYELSPCLLRPLSEVNEKSITPSSRFWDRTLNQPSQSFLSYNGTMH